jgi:hypothetical protein
MGVAAVGGVAYAAGRSGARRGAEEHWQAEQPAPAPVPRPVPQSVAEPAVSTDDRIRQLKELAELKQAGVLSDADVEREKDRILRGD